MEDKSLVRGAAKLRQTLRLLPPNVTSEVRVAVSSFAGIVLRKALANVPRNTGLLASQLRITYSSDKLGAKIGVLGIRSARKAYYAHWVEYGTTKQPAHPFLYPALKDSASAGIKLIDAAIDRALTRAGSGLGPTSTDSGGEGETE